MARDYSVIIHDAERAAVFERAFGSDVHLYITSPVPVAATAPGHPTGALFYLLDLDEYNAVRLEALAREISSIWQLRLSDVRRDMDTVGVPIIDKDVSVMFHHHPLRFL